MLFRRPPWPLIVWDKRNNSELRTGSNKLTIFETRKVQITKTNYFIYKQAKAVSTFSIKDDLTQLAFWLFLRSGQCRRKKQ